MLISLIITLTAGLLFLLGLAIISKVKNKDQIYIFSSSLALCVILGLIVFDIFPEILESYTSFALNKKIIYITAFILIGIIILKILDILIPNHIHDHKEHEKNTEEHDGHLFHISFITSIALFIHNIIEGVAIYTIAFKDLNLGLLMCLGVGLHNIPLGIQISLAMDMSHKNKYSKIILYFSLAISTFLGGIIAMLFNNISQIVIGILLCITCGMLIYIALAELWHDVKNNLKDKYTWFGILTGFILILLTTLL